MKLCNLGCAVTLLVIGGILLAVGMTCLHHKTDFGCAHIHVTMIDVIFGLGISLLVIGTVFLIGVFYRCIRRTQRV